jgi:hypothetical protein
MVGEPVGIGKFAPTRPVRPDEIRIAEIALRRRTIPLAPAPQVAAGEAQEHGAAPCLDALTLKRKECFLDGVAHAPM